jgi:hypothetical protein
MPSLVLAPLLVVLMAVMAGPLGDRLLSTDGKRPTDQNQSASPAHALAQAAHQVSNALAVHAILPSPDNRTAAERGQRALRHSTLALPGTIEGRRGECPITRDSFRRTPPTLPRRFRCARRSLRLKDGAWPRRRVMTRSGSAADARRHHQCQGLAHPPPAEQACPWAQHRYCCASVRQHGPSCWQLPLTKPLQRSGRQHLSSDGHPTTSAMHSTFCIFSVVWHSLVLVHAY